MRINLYYEWGWAFHDSIRFVKFGSIFNFRFSENVNSNQIKINSI